MRSRLFREKRMQPPRLLFDFMKSYKGRRRAGGRRGKISMIIRARM